MVTDQFIVQMATEVRQALEARGLDPNNPPNNSAPPSAQVFAEYLRRGGIFYHDADACAKALVEEVVAQAKRANSHAV